MSRAAFEPFKDDFEAIVTSYKALSWEKKEGGSSDDDRRDDDSDDNLTKAVNDLLRQIYAYISWGIRSEAGSEREVDQTLEKLGFRVPERGGRRLLDIVAPAAGLVAAITIVFWPSVDFISSAMGAPAPTASESIIFALTSAGGAMFMYGLAALIAFDRRASQIEKKTWRAGSPRCLLPIAIWCGAVTWAVVMATTIFGQWPQAERSLTGIAHLIGSFAMSGTASSPTGDDWTFLPTRFVTALPWMLPGATVCVILAWSIGGDVRRTDTGQRIRDAMVLEIGLGIAVAAAQLIQTALMEIVFGEKAIWYFVPIVGLAGVGCGAVIGFMVPYACRANIVMPLDPMVARDLRRLRDRADAAFGSKIAAANWLFMPNNELGGITPAEAVQYKTHATGVRPLLEQDVVRFLDEARSASSCTHVRRRRRRGGANRPRVHEACGCRIHAALNRRYLAPVSTTCRRRETRPTSRVTERVARGTPAHPDGFSHVLAGAHRDAVASVHDSPGWHGSISRTRCRRLSFASVGVDRLHGPVGVADADG